MEKTSETDNSTAFFQARVLDMEMMEWLVRIQSNRRLPNSIFYPLLFAYASMIIFGVVANLLIIGLIIRQRSRYDIIRR